MLKEEPDRKMHQCVRMRDAVVQCWHCAQTGNASPHSYGMFPGDDNKSLSTTGAVLQALLECRNEGVPWKGQQEPRAVRMRSRAQRDRSNRILGTTRKY